MSAREGGGVMRASGGRLELAGGDRSVHNQGIHDTVSKHTLETILKSMRSTHEVIPGVRR